MGVLGRGGIFSGGIDSSNVAEAFATNELLLSIRNARAVSYGAVFRAVTLTAQSISWLITEGHLRVVRLDGTEIKNGRTRRVLDLMAGMPDGIRPAETLWADAGADYSIFGNGLAAVRRDSMFQPVGLRLLDANGAYTTEGRQGSLMYTAAPAYSNNRAYEDYTARDIIHARWPLMGSSASSVNGQRLSMAESPLRLLDREIRIGIAADAFVLDYFSEGKGGIKSKIAIGIKGTLNDEQVAKQEQIIQKYMAGRGPLIALGDPTFTHINESPSDAETSELRKRQSISTGRIFGIPAPLMSEEGSTWGSGIDALIRGYWRFGLRNHLGSFLAGARIALLGRNEKFAINEMLLHRGDPKSMATLINAVRGDAQRDAIWTGEEIREFTGASAEPEGTLRLATGRQPQQPAASAGTQP